MEIDAALVHKRFPAAAEYVSGIYTLARDSGKVSNSRLAAWTGVTGSAVTQALGRLKRLQSEISDDLTEHLFIRLGSPQTCPHGNPMPEKSRHVRYESR